MAVFSIGHRPDLSVEQVIGIFERQFADKHKVITLPQRDWRKINPRHFMIKKNAWVAVSGALKQERDDTKLVITGHVPSFWTGLILIPTLGILSLFLSTGLMNEVRAFIETSRDFRSR